jgi:NAD(P)H-nitrite reductase large subunit
MHHVIVGGGPAAVNCIETIRQFDAGASQITLISDEPAHSRMALPYWLSGKVPREHVLTADSAYYETLKVDARIGIRVERVDAQRRLATLSDGSSVAFDKLFIATGSSPVGLPVSGGTLPGVQPMWTLAHTQGALEAVAGIRRPKVVLVGAGFIGFIVLNAMYHRGWELAVVEREPHVLPRMLDFAAAKIVETWLASKGVAVHCGTTVQAVEPASGGKKHVSLADGRRLDVDLVVVATGIRPNIALLEGSGIALNQGILVNARCQTNDSSIYAGGDVAQGPALYGNGPAIHAIQPTAVDHGRIAGANMAGHEAIYSGSLLMNVLDVCGLQCASFGNWSGPNVESMTISNPGDFIYRNLLWSGERIVGAIFVGRSNDLGMLNDVGMIKGILQTETALGDWKRYLSANPFDIRRPFIAARVPEKLSQTTLLGRPARARQFRYSGTPIENTVGPAHQVFMASKS